MSNHLILWDVSINTSLYTFTLLRIKREKQFSKSRLFSKEVCEHSQVS